MTNISLTEKDFINIVFDLEMNIALQKEMIELIANNYQEAIKNYKSIYQPIIEDKYEISNHAIDEMNDMIQKLMNTEDKNNELWFKSPLEYASIVALYQDKRNEAISYKASIHKENGNIQEQNKAMFIKNRQAMQLYTQNIQVLWKQLNDVNSTLKETEDVLNHYYDNTDFLPNKKYHNILTLSMINEYFNDHRADTIGEALNIYNNEIQHQNIESKLDNLSLRVDNLEEQLVGINQNQHVLYEAIQENHDVMLAISDVMLAISNDMIAQKDEIQHLNQKILDVNSGVQSMEDKMWKSEDKLSTSNRLLIECQRISDANHRYTHQLNEYTNQLLETRQRGMR